jgi:uncharacterized membrane protein
MGLVVLTLGVALWFVAHLFKRLAPRLRAAMAESMGDAGKGVFAALILASIVFMVIGYQRAETVWLWPPQVWMLHLNNLLVLIAFYVFGIGMARGALSQKLRHPMLIGTLIWALAHLMVRGHLAGLILFGGLALWAVAAMVLINTQDREWTPKPPKGGIMRDLIAVPIVLVVYYLVSLAHHWLGVNPFGGT